MQSSPYETQAEWTAHEDPASPWEAWEASLVSAEHPSPEDPEAALYRWEMMGIALYGLNRARSAARAALGVLMAAVALVLARLHLRQDPSQSGVTCTREVESDRGPPTLLHLTETTIRRRGPDALCRAPLNGRPVDGAFS